MEHEFSKNSDVNTEGLRELNQRADSSHEKTLLTRLYDESMGIGGERMISKRPKIKVNRTGVDVLLECTACMLSMSPIFYLLAKWSSLPARVPTHINASGVVDSWGGRSELLIMPAIMVAMFVLLSVIQRFPHSCNYLVRITEENAEVQYRNAVSMLGWMNLIINAGLAMVFFSMIQIAQGDADRLTYWVMPVFMGCLFGSLGYYLWLSWKNR